ncbi:MAG TPA: right-handed parallel beta-helix repeat-containing protein [Terriglobales bacterium]|nr:right-handed parallel beta-helix repeat-containing protein [Terriglobales bacterium]
MKLRTAYVLAALGILLLAAVSAHATDVNVNCGAKKNNSIQAAINSLSKQGPHTITVSGVCNEALLIDQFDSLKLVSTTGASINDPTPAVPDDNDVIDVVGSRQVRIEGFTINGGVEGIACFAYSSCVLWNNTVQGAADSAVFIGRQSAAEIQNSTLQDSAIGLTTIYGGETVVFNSTIQDNQDVGVYVSSHSLLRITNGGTGPTTISGNANAGVFMEINSTVFVGQNAANVTGNTGGPGVAMFMASVLRFAGTGNSISNNGAGVDVGDSSFAFVGGNATMTGNTGGDVLCSGTFSNATGKFPCHNP